MIDGGKGQLTSAVKVLQELGLDEEISVCSLAKQFEEVFVPGRSDAIRIPRQSEALYLLSGCVKRPTDSPLLFTASYETSG